MVFCMFTRPGSSQVLVWHQPQNLIRDLDRDGSGVNIGTPCKYDV